MQHRQDIDGLRAVSVIPVILFHAGLQWFKGGFVGVDVFFVISGYLITGIIWAELQTRTFSIASFYERRARRILPALFLVMFACLPAAWLLMTPQDLRSFSQSLIAVPVFSSNILFWLSSGYFETSAELKPLLHTWSLAVEEQYYVFFPILLMLLAPWGRRRVAAVLGALLLLSLGLAQYQSAANPDQAFYLLPTRVWELLLGALLVMTPLQQHMRSGPLVWRQAASLTGLAMIVGAMFTFDKHTPSPSVYTLIPTVGATLVIACATPETWVARLLSARWLVGIGLISYSAYLWHQPLFAFARHQNLEAPSAQTMAMLVLLTFALAYLSWRFVETPMRRQRALSRAQIFGASAALASMLMAVGLAGHMVKIKTWWEFQNPGLVNVSRPDALGPTQDCRAQLGGLGDASCTVVGSGPRKVVVWGDSHAKALMAGLPHPEGVTMYVISHLGCPPLVGVHRFDGLGTSGNCSDPAVLGHYAGFIQSLKPDSVILVGRWTLYLNGFIKAGLPQAQHHFLSDGDDQAALTSATYRIDMMARHLQETIGLFSPHAQVIVLTQPIDLASFNYREVEHTNFAAPASAILAWHHAELEMFSRLAPDPKVKVVDVKKLFCNDQACRTRVDGTLLYADDNHLSAFGSRIVWQSLGDSIQYAATEE